MVRVRVAVALTFKALSFLFKFSSAQPVTACCSTFATYTYTHGQAKKIVPNTHS